MNTSKYLIDVPLESNKKLHMLIHGYTAAIDIVAAELAEYLVRHPVFQKTELPCSEEIVCALEKRGYITEKTPEEEYAYVRRLANALFRKDCIFHKSFTFVVTYNCNFRCPYCFENGLHNKKTVFTKEMTDKAYLAIEKIVPSKEQYPRNIILYGGEPLLENNRDTLSYIISKGKEKGFRFSAITNGYDLDAYNDLLSSETFTHMQITIDGVKNRHNQRRIHYQGYPTFDKIVENIGLVLQKGISVSVRINTDRDNINDLKELQTLFENLHYTDNPNFSMNSSLLRNYSDNEGEIYKFFTQKEFLQEYDKLQLRYECQDYGAYQRIYNAIKYRKPLSLKATFCGAQTSGYVFDPFGKIYTCWEVVNQPMHCIGDYAQEDKIQWNEDVIKFWRKSHIVENPTCARCKYALLCGSGCPAQNLKQFSCLHMEDIIDKVVNKAFREMQ